MSSVEPAKRTALEKRASDLLHKAKELSIQAEQILARLPSAVCKGRRRRERERLVEEAASLRKLASDYYDMVDAIEDRLDEEAAPGRVRVRLRHRLSRPQ